MQTLLELDAQRVAFVNKKIREKKSEPDTNDEPNFDDGDHADKGDLLSKTSPVGSSVSEVEPPSNELHNDEPAMRSPETSSSAKTTSWDELCSTSG